MIQRLRARSVAREVLGATLLIVLVGYYLAHAAGIVAALGGGPDVAACFAALVAGSVAATIGFMPGGLGTFESASVAALTATGTPAAVALGATLLLRGFTFWLPMIPGAFLLRGTSNEAFS